MTRKAIISGMISGLLLSLGLLYPTIVFFVYRINPLWFAVDIRPAATAPGLLMSGIVAFFAFIAVGVLPAIRTGATSWPEGARAGALSGLVAAVTVFGILVAPTNAWQATIPTFNYPPTLNALLPEDVLATFSQKVLVRVYTRDLPIVALAGVLIGWLLGGITGLVRRDQREDRLTLLEVLGIRRGRRRWFAHNDDSTRAALLAGIICGGLIAFTSLSDTSSTLLDLNSEAGFSVTMTEGAPLSLPNVFSGLPRPISNFLSGLSNVLSPVAVVAFFVFGALAIIFLKDPPRWFGSRWSAATFAGMVVGALVYLPAARVLFAAIGLWPYQGQNMLMPDMAATSTLVAPQVQVAAFFLLPLLGGIGTVLALTVVGAAQGVIYGLILTPIFRRPIDRALSLRSRLRDNPDQVLPQLYSAYNRHSDAINILPHLAFSLGKKYQPQARIIAAHHLLSTRPERAAEAIAVIGDTLDEQPNWRWRNEVDALYHVLRQGWLARTTSQISAIEPIPEAQTSSLPVMLSRASALLTQVLTELRKVERVDDLNSKTIFLNNTLEAIRVARRHAQAMSQGWISLHPTGDAGEPFRQLWEGDPNIQAMKQRFETIKEPEDFKNAMRTLLQVQWGRNMRETFRLAGELRRDVQDRHTWVHTAYPEARALDRMLDQWEGVVLNAVKDLQGRAALVSELKTKQLNYMPALPVTLSIRNDGFNIAESVRLIVTDGEGYRVTAGAEQTIDILTAKSARDVEVTIQPQSRDRVRVNWRIQYYDAVDKDRTVEFADVIEFIGGEQAARPFVRIFPIPYVTGMPLKTEHLFVGRQDVFAYIQEHLFGTYQNNVIVLHGQRRTGKTSILYRLKKVMAATHIAVLVDMQGKAARGTVDFFYSLADDIVYTLEDQGITVELPPRADFADSPEFFFRSRFLRSVYAVLPPVTQPEADRHPHDGEQPHRKHLLLMFDEFEELQKRVEDGKLDAEVFPFLRNLMQHEEPLDFVFAGTHKLEELGAEYWSILFNIASYKKITFLSHDDAQRLIAEPVKPNLEYDPLAIERIIGVTGGHPYFTQVVCHELVSYHNETQRSYLTANDVTEVLDRIVERGEAHFKFIWAESSSNERLVLLTLADLLENTETASADDVEALLDKRACCLDNAAKVPQVLDRLEMGDILTRSGPRSNLFRFKIDLIRRWIYATRPV
ncbi:hypothetical protein TFLX_00481 [Thermoflexales bacterium]|nr:hypothetical protein TFLX_00481 [Thermoflexales bacterium]